MIKHRLAALFFRSISLGVSVYAIYQILMEANIFERNWLDELLQFPHYLIVLTGVMQLYMIIKGITQIKKQGVSGITKISAHVRGGFVVSGLLLILFNHVILTPSLINSPSILHIISYDVCGVFWILDWFLFDERNQTKKISPILWLLLQVYGYLGIVMVRGNSTNSQNPYVYDILNLERYGIAGIGKNIAVISGIYIIAGLIIYFLDHLGESKSNEL